MRNASGTARPAPIAPCGLMFAAMDGAISASERPTACQTERERLSPDPCVVFSAGVVAIHYLLRARSVSAVCALDRRHGRGKSGRCHPPPPREIDDGLETR